MRGFINWFEEAKGIIGLKHFICNRKNSFIPIVLAITNRLEDKICHFEKYSCAMKSHNTVDNLIV